jgi:signal transduction histidine kinase
MATAELSTLVETRLHVAQRSRKSSDAQQNPAPRGVGPVSLSDHSAPDAGSGATTTATGPYLALAARNHPLTGNRPCADQQRMRSRAEPIDDDRPASPQWLPPSPSIDMRRLERDLHDHVQTELVSLIVRLKLAEEDDLTPPELAGKLSGLGDHACAVLEALREITQGFQPIALSRHGVAAALKARAARSPIPVTVSGAAPRSTDEAEEAVYFACSEAIQNTIKHAGPEAELTISLRQDHRTLTVQAQDDGCGFDLTHAHAGSGLRNITDRIHARGGSVELTSKAGLGTRLVISVPWPAPAS